MLLLKNLILLRWLKGGAFVNTFTSGRVTTTDYSAAGASLATGAATGAAGITGT